MKRQKFLQELRALLPRFGKDNIIYFDESGFEAHTYRDSGWALRGVKIFGDVVGKREKRTNLIMAQQGKGKTVRWLAPMIFKGSCTAQTVEAWISKFLLKELKNPTIVIMESEACHLGITRHSTTKNDLKKYWQKRGIIYFPCPHTHLTSIPLRTHLGA